MVRLGRYCRLFRSCHIVLHETHCSWILVVQQQLSLSLIIPSSSSQYDYWQCVLHWSYRYWQDYHLSDWTGRVRLPRGTLSLNCLLQRRLGRITRERLLRWSLIGQIIFREAGQWEETYFILFLLFLGCPLQKYHFRLWYWREEFRYENNLIKEIRKNWYQIFPWK